MRREKENTSIVYLDRDGLPARIQLPTPSAPHTWVNYPSTDPKQVIERSQNADILVVNKVNIGGKTLDACPGVKHIVVSATGVNVIDLSACEARGVSVSHVPSYAATTVAEHVIGVTIGLRRELIRYSQSVTNNEWQRSAAFCLFGKPFHNVSGATIGLIGLGEIGEAVAARAHALGMTVLFCARTERLHDYAEQVSLEQLLQRSDIVSVHCSLNESTQGLIGKREIALMQAHGILINTARGGIVDEQAAADAINNASIAGLAFDVLLNEPPLGDEPLLNIAHLPNVLITPHIAWASEQAMQHLANTVTRNIDAFINGSPINLVTTHH